MGQEVRRLHPNVPVILTSGYSHARAQKGRHGFELLHKSYSVEQLARLLRKALACQVERVQPLETNRTSRSSYKARDESEVRPRSTRGDAFRLPLFDAAYKGQLTSSHSERTRKQLRFQG